MWPVVELTPGGECGPGADWTIGWWKFDEGSGTTTADSSGHGNTASFANTPTWSTGHTGPFALTFNGGTAAG